jgi:putative resolvase
MKVSEWARREGVHYQTAWRWWKNGVLPVPARQLPTGTVLVDVPVPAGSGRTVAYCRVASADQRDDLDRQVGRVAAAATARGLSVDAVVTEVGSGLTGKRRKLTQLLSDPAATVIVVEHRDRLARFGVEHLDAALAACGRRLVVLEEAEVAGVDDELVPDLTEVLTSLCARLYGRGSARRRVRAALRAAAEATG